MTQHGVAYSFFYNLSYQSCCQITGHNNRNIFITEIITIAVPYFRKSIVLTIHQQRRPIEIPR